jgi:hypothetical protein
MFERTGFIPLSIINLYKPFSITPLLSPSIIPVVCYPCPLYLYILGSSLRVILSYPQHDRGMSVFSGRLDAQMGQTFHIRSGGEGAGSIFVFTDHTNYSIFIARSNNAYILYLKR